MAFLSSFLAPKELIQGKNGRPIERGQRIQFVVLTAKYHTIGKLNMETISAHSIIPFRKNTDCCVD